MTDHKKQGSPSHAQGGARNGNGAEGPREASPQSVFEPPAFNLTGIADAYDVLDFLTYLKEELQMELFPGFDFDYCTHPEAPNGTHVFTAEEAATGNRLLEQARGLIGSYQLDEAFRDDDIFNTRKFSHRHLRTMEDVCDFVDYMRGELGEVKAPYRMGPGRDLMMEYRKTMCTNHEFTELEVALLCRFSYEAWDICEAEDFDYFSVVSDCNDWAGFFKGEVARVREVLRTGDREEKARIEREHYEHYERSI